MRMVTVAAVAALVSLVGLAASVQTPVAAGGQQASERTAGIYAVSYLEVKRSAEHAAIEALRAYREASRKETGWIATELLGQVGRPGHFVMIESWADPDTLDAHDRSTGAGLLERTLAPIRSSEYDRRPYKPLTNTAPSGQATNETVVVVSHVDTLPSPQSDAAGLLRSLAEQSRLDAGNLLFNVVQHARPNHFTVIEMWRDRGAQQAHAEAPHVREYRDKLKAILGSPLDERLFTVVR
jgi:quinol monooxygenase YgiN